MTWTQIIKNRWERKLDGSKRKMQEEIDNLRNDRLDLVRDKKKLMARIMEDVSTARKEASEQVERRYQQKI